MRLIQRGHRIPEKYSAQLLRQTPQIDYFATSLPAMLLFDEDLNRRNQIDSLFLEAQGLFGLGKTTEGRSKLDEVLAIDPSHAAAIDLIDEVGFDR